MMPGLLIQRAPCLARLSKFHTAVGFFTRAYYFCHLSLTDLQHSRYECMFRPDDSKARGNVFF